MKLGAKPSTALLFTLAIGLAGCKTEEKVVNYKPFFAGLSGAEFATAPVEKDTGRAAPVASGEATIVIEEPDGSKRLVAYSPRHVMLHVENCLDEQQDELFLRDMVDDQAKEHFRTTGKDPMEFVKRLRKHRKDIAKLFARMPMAENSPTVIIDQPGNRTWVITLTGKPAEGLVWTRLWVRNNMGQFKLLWID